MGEPSLSSTTWIHVLVKDSDDLDPIFSHPVYTANIQEHPGPDIVRQFNALTQKKKIKTNIGYFYVFNLKFFFRELL